MNEIEKSKKEKPENSIANIDQFRNFEKTFATLKAYLAASDQRRKDIKTKHHASRRVIGKDNHGNDVYGDYLPISFFKALIDKEFPGLWDWEPAHQPIVVGGKLIVTDGVFTFFDEKRFSTFTALGVSPDKAFEKSWRKFYSVAAGVYQFSQNNNPISVAGPPKTANSFAFIKGAQMATNLGADTYAKDDTLTMSVDKIEEVIAWIMQQDLNDDKIEILCNKSFFLVEEKVPSFKLVVSSELPWERKLKAIDNLYEIKNNETSIKKFDTFLANANQKYIKENQNEETRG